MAGKAKCPICHKEMKQKSIAGHLANPNIHGQGKSAGKAARVGTLQMSGLRGELGRIIDIKDAGEPSKAQDLYDFYIKGRPNPSTIKSRRGKESGNAVGWIYEPEVV